MSQNKHDTYKETENLETGEEQATAGGAPEAAETAGPETIESLKAALEAAREAAADNLDKLLRAKAEAENARRRAEIDVTNARKFAIEKFAGEVLTVRDSLELARAVDIGSDGAQLIDKMLEGLDLTLRQMDNVLEKFNLTIVNPQGEVFDPDRHQAIGMVESGEVAPNHVLTVVQKGAMLNDRLLRPAMVIIAKAGEGANNT